MQDILIFAEHHKLLVSTFFAVLLALTIVEFIRQKRGATRLSPTRVTQLMNHENACIVDIRSQDAFASGHIIGAVSIPLKELPEKYKKLEKFKSNPIVLVCAAGLESPKATAQLIQQGYRTFVLAGGMRAWNDAEMPVVKD